MADTKISNLTNGSDIQSADQIPVERSGANFKVNVSSILSRVTTLENNEYKRTVFQQISGSSGTVTLTTHSTILPLETGQTVSAYIFKIGQNSQPLNEYAYDTLGLRLTVTSFNSAGDYVLSGTPAVDVNILFFIKIKGIYLSELDPTKVLGVAELINPPYITAADVTELNTRFPSPPEGTPASVLDSGLEWATNPISGNYIFRSGSWRLLGFENISDWIDFIDGEKANKAGATADEILIDDGSGNPVDSGKTLTDYDNDIASLEGDVDAIYNIVNYPKIYACFLSQSGTNNPVADVVKNNLGYNPAWTRETNGVYKLSASIGDAFIKASEFKTLVPKDGTYTSIVEGSADGQYTIYSGDIFAVLGDDILNRTYIEIKKYVAVPSYEFSVDAASFAKYKFGCSTADVKIITDWGDGLFDTTSVVAGSGYNNITHTYAGTGTKIVKVYVLDFAVASTDYQLSIGDAGSVQSITTLSLRTVELLATQGNIPTSNINSILIFLDTLGLTTSTIDVSNQTPSAPPSGAGATAKANLISAGNTVTTD